MRSSDTTTVIAWVLQVPLGLVMAGGRAAKLSGDVAMITLFDDIGAGPWLRFVVGTLEVLGGVGLLSRACEHSQRSGSSRCSQVRRS